MKISVSERTLTDGSHVYTVHLRQGFSHIELDCASEREAQIMAEAFKNGTNFYTLETVPEVVTEY